MDVPELAYYSECHTLNSGIFMRVAGSLSRILRNKSTRFRSSFSGINTLQLRKFVNRHTLDALYSRTVQERCDH